MQTRSAVRVGRTLGGVVAALAVIPWLGAGTALASPSSDSDCSTVPGGVSATATCAVLGTSAGEVWAARSTANELKVKVFLVTPLASGDAINLCVTKAGPYAPGTVCSAAAVWSSTDLTFTYPLGASFIGKSDPVWFAVTAGNVEVNDTALGQGPAVAAPSGSPSASPSSTSSSPSPSVSPTDTGSPSPSVSPTDTGSPSPSVSPTDTGSPSPSVSPTDTGSPTPSVSPTASTSVLPTKIQGSTEPAVAGLAHTGGNGEMGTVLASLALLGVGGAMIVGAQVRRAPVRRH